MLSHSLPSLPLSISSHSLLLSLPSLSPPPLTPFCSLTPFSLSPSSHSLLSLPSVSSLSLDGACG